MLATQIEVSDGTLDTVNVGIQFFEQDDIEVSLDQADPLVLGVGYVWSTATTIEFLDTVDTPGGLVPLGVEVVLRRDTKNDAMYNVFDGGAPFSRLTLDENYKQLLFLSQEFSEGLGLDGLRNNFNMNGYRIINVGDPVDPGDAVNKAYLDASSATHLRTPENIPVLPDAITRAGLLLGFDIAGNPVAVAPASGSAEELALDLANSADPLKGAAMVGYNGNTVAEYLTQRQADLSSTSGSLGISLIGGANRVVDTIAALQALPVTGSTVVFVLGYYAAGDGGGGMYRLFPADVSTADGGRVFTTSSTGRWRLCQTAPVTIKQYGCKGDNVTDDTARFLAAVNAGLPLHIPEGKFKVAPIGPAAVYPGGREPNRTSGAVLSTGQNITGEGPQSELIWNNATVQAFFGVTNAKDITVSKVKFTGGYSAIIVDPASNGSVDNVGLQNCVLDGQLIGFIGGRQYALDANSKSSKNIWMTGCDVRNTVVHGFMVSNCDRARVTNNHFENLTGGFCCDFSQGTRGGILANNTAATVQYFAKAESSNVYVPGGTINADPTVPASRDISVTGNVVTGLQLIGMLINSAEDRILVMGNEFSGSITVGIDCAQVTGFTHDGQLIICNNSIKMTSINAIGIRSNQTTSTMPALVQGNNMKGGSVGITWLPTIGSLLNNVIDNINNGINLTGNPMNLDIRNNRIKSDSGIVGAGVGAHVGIHCSGNTFDVTTWSVYLGAAASVSVSSFTNNTVKNTTVRAPGSLLVNNPRAVRFSGNDFNLNTGSGSSVQTTGTALGCMLNNNIGTAGLAVAGPDATTTAQTVNNITAATYVP